MIFALPPGDYEQLPMMYAKIESDFDFLYDSVVVHPKHIAREVVSYRSCATQSAINSSPVNNSQVIAKGLLQFCLIMTVIDRVHDMVFFPNRAGEHYL